MVSGEPASFKEGLQGKKQNHMKAVKLTEDLGVHWWVLPPMNIKRQQLNQQEKVKVAMSLTPITISHIVRKYIFLTKYKRYQKFHGGSVVKNLPVVQETQVQSLGLEDALEKEMATHSIFGWQIFLPGESQRQTDWWAAVYGVTKSQTQLSD